MHSHEHDVRTYPCGTRACVDAQSQRPRRKNWHDERSRYVVQRLSENLVATVWVGFSDQFVGDNVWSDRRCMIWTTSCGRPVGVPKQRAAGGQVASGKSIRKTANPRRRISRTQFEYFRQNTLTKRPTHNRRDRRNYERSGRPMTSLPRVLVRRATSIFIDRRSRFASGICRSNNRSVSSVTLQLKSLA